MKNQFNENHKNVLFARQAILDKELKVKAYELLYRPSYDSLSSGLEGSPHSKQNSATANVLMNAFAHTDFTEFSTSELIFINFNRECILENMYHVLPKDRCVIEILEHVDLDEEVSQIIKKMHAEGYKVALDDFEYKELVKPLLPFIHYIKLDINAMTKSELQYQLNKLKDFKGELIAEKIETHEDYTWCLEKGFNYFQGYFFAKPNIVQGQQMQSNQVAMLQLLAQLQSPEIDLAGIEKIISQDITFSYKLLRIMNSPALRVSRKISSLREAVIYLGLNNIRTWATIASLSSVNNKPAELTKISLLRAKMCALIAEKLGYLENNAFFTAGLLSTIDAIFDNDMTTVLAKLALTEELNRALLKREGTIGHTLKNVINYQLGKWKQVDTTQLTLEEYNETYLESISWTQETCSYLL